MRLFYNYGNDILSRRFNAVPSALMGLTTLFGMGRGGHHRYSHHKVLYVFIITLTMKEKTKINKREFHRRKLTGY